MEENVSDLDLLRSTGISKECLAVYEKAKTEEERMCILRQWRQKILKQVHMKQNLLDQIDYLIHLKQKEKTAE